MLSRLLKQVLAEDQPRPTGQPYTTTTPPQHATPGPSMSSLDYRGMKHEFKQERKAIRAEMKEYRHESRGDRRASRHERRAVKQAVKAELWNAVVGRLGQGQTQTQRQQEMGAGPAYGTGYERHAQTQRQQEMGAGPAYGNGYERHAQTQRQQETGTVPAYGNGYERQGAERPRNERPMAERIVEDGRGVVGPPPAYEEAVRGDVKGDVKV